MLDPEQDRSVTLFSQTASGADGLTTSASCMRRAKMRPLNAAQRYKLTSSLFLLTFFGAVFTVAAPSVFPCPAFEQRRAGLAHADGWHWDGLGGRKRRVQPRGQQRPVIQKRPEGCDGDGGSGGGL
jgi:hypothetical protein